jgi:hypothetical protein
MAEKSNRLVEIIIPMWNDCIKDPTKMVKWDDYFPMPPENTQIFLPSSIHSDKVVAVNKDTKKGYVLSYNKRISEYVWKANRSGGKLLQNFEEFFN